MASPVLPMPQMKQQETLPLRIIAPPLRSLMENRLLPPYLKHPLRKHPYKVKPLTQTPPKRQRSQLLSTSKNTPMFRRPLLKTSALNRAVYRRRGISRSAIRYFRCRALCSPMRRTPQALPFGFRLRLSTKLLKRLR